VIIRILGEGQFEVPQDRLEELDRLDEALADAVDRGDEEEFTSLLDRLLAAVRHSGEPVDAEHIGPSDAVLPGPHTSLEEVREMLHEEGLIVV